MGNHQLLFDVWYFRHLALECATSPHSATAVATGLCSSCTATGAGYSSANRTTPGWWLITGPSCVVWTASTASGESLPSFLLLSWRWLPSPNFPFRPFHPFKAPKSYSRKRCQPLRQEVSYTKFWLVTFPPTSTLPDTSINARPPFCTYSTFAPTTPTFPPNEEALTPQSRGSSTSQEQDGAGSSTEPRASRSRER